MAELEPKNIVEEQVEVSAFPDEKKHLVTAHGDRIAQEALGNDVPPGYYTSGYFIGTSLVSYRYKLDHTHGSVQSFRK
jgi:hypothetical protein